MIEIFLAGEPKGKGRPRFVRSSGRTYTPKETVSYESALRIIAQMEMEGRAMLLGPLAVKIVAAFSIPASFSRKKRQAAIDGNLVPTKKPDWDNIAKLTDALNAVVWKDDAQIVGGTVLKQYSETPGLKITVTEIA